MSDQVDLPRERWRLFARIAVVLFISPSLLSAMAQHANGRGAMSAQDMAKMASAAGAEVASPYGATADPADQVCARFASGSATTAPPELISQGGVLEVTFKFLTATDSQGLVRYCYVTDTGLEAPTLRVNPGDQLIIHFQNDLPAASASSASDNMAGMESVSANVPITISNFALASSGATAAVGSAAIAPVTVNVASNYTAPISLTCTMPASLTQSACFVNPNSMTGTGQASLTVNTTPAHPQSSSLTGARGWITAGGGASFACVFLLALPRRGWRGRAIFVLSFMAILFTVIGCGGTAQTDPGTPKGTYTVVVTATAGSGSSQQQTSVNVPITIQ